MVAWGRFMAQPGRSLHANGGDGLKQQLDRRTRRFRAVLLLAVGLLLLSGLYLGVQWLEKQNEKPEASGDHTMRYAYSGLMDYEGATYRRRGSITTILLMGIDQDGQRVSSGYRNGGQADFLRLLVLDDRERKLTQIQIDRDTVTPITVLGVLGDKAGTRTAQICLSHGFGDGREQSCELTADAVSNLLCGIPIDFYMALNLDGISTLNDLLGGVTVTLSEDFSALDPAMTQGATLTLMGDQAEYYVRGRMRIGIGTNEARMARQEQYISIVSELLGARLSENQEFIGTVYDALSPYLITNISRGRLINMAWAAKDYERASIIKLEGDHEVGPDGYMQFHADEAALRRMVVALFYEKLKEN